MLDSDVAQHLSMARNILDGNGIATSIVFYDENYHVGRVPAAQTVFPPGYPFLIAALSKCGIPLNVSTLVICLLSFNFCTVLIIGSIRKAGHPWSIALLGGILWGGSMSAGFLTLFSMSDVPFAFMTAVSFICIQRMQTERGWYALLAGAAAAAAFSIRYAGIFLIVSLGVVLVGRIVMVRTRRAVIEAIAVLSLPALTVAALFLRNFLIVGDFKGGNANPLGKSIADVAHLFTFSFKELIGYSPYSYVANAWREIAIIAIVLLIVAILGFVRPKLNTEKIKLLRCDMLHILAAVYIVVSLTGLFYLEYTRTLGVSPRMILPIIYPTILLFCGLLASIEWKEQFIQGTLFSGLIALLYIIGQTGMIHTISARIKYHETYTRSVRIALSESATIQQLLAEDKADGSPLLANQPHSVGGITQQPVLGLTLPYFTAKKWTNHVVEEVVRTFGVRHVLFFPQLFEIERSGDKANQDFFKGIANNQMPNWLAPVYTSDDLIIFQVNL